MRYVIWTCSLIACNVVQTTNAQSERAFSTTTRYKDSSTTINTRKHDCTAVYAYNVINSTRSGNFGAIITDYGNISMTDRRVFTKGARSQTGEELVNGYNSRIALDDPDTWSEC